jgi:hypothetical protein
MSTTFSPFGLKPVYHPSGLDRAMQFAGTNSFTPGSSGVSGTSGYTAPYSLTTGQSFFEFQPVAINTNGQLTIAGSNASGAGSSSVYGVFNGVEYTSAEGRRSVAKYASKTTLDSASNIIFWIFTDTRMIYECQIQGSANANAIGQEYNFSSSAGYTPTDGYSIGNGGAGFSTCALAASPVGSGVVGQTRVVGLGREVAYPTGQLNQWGDAYTIVQVQLNSNNQFVAQSASV